MIGNIPPQPLLDLGGFAELVKELKSGKGDTLLIEIRDRIKELRAAEAEQSARVQELTKQEESAAKAVTRADKAKDEVREARAGLKADVEAFHVEKQRAEDALSVLRADQAERDADLAEREKSLDSRLRTLLKREGKLAEAEAKAQDLQTLYEGKLTKIRAAAEE
jgi:chromosome segregation ATPase